MIYVIVQCGHEGFEKLVFATIEESEVIIKIKELREDIIRARKHRAEVLGIKEGEEYDSDEIESAWDTLYFEEKITQKEHDDAEFVNPDSYCIQKWDGEKFTCVCQELEVPPKEPWFM